MFFIGKLGANAILGVSMVVSQAAAFLLGKPLFMHLSDIYQMDCPSLPLPFLNIINGGAHAGNQLPFQEFMIVPISASSFSECMKMGTEVYHSLKMIIKSKYGQNGKSFSFWISHFAATNVGDEGGFAPNVGEPKECLDLIMEAIRKAKYEGKMAIALDVAASGIVLFLPISNLFVEFYRNNLYNFDSKSNVVTPRTLTGEELAHFYLDLCTNYPSMFSFCFAFF